MPFIAETGPASPIFRFIVPCNDGTAPPSPHPGPADAPAVLSVQVCPP